MSAQTPPPFSFTPLLSPLPVSAAFPSPKIIKPRISAPIPGMEATQLAVSKAKLQTHYRSFLMVFLRPVIPPASIHTNYPVLPCGRGLGESERETDWVAGVEGEDQDTGRGGGV